MTEQFRSVRKKVKKALDKERWEHTKGVVYTAAALAMAHGEDIDKAMMAGLLHDCAKCIPHAEKIAICKKEKIALKQVELKNPSLIHAKLGAFLAKEKYGVRSREIRHAIRTHTTGSPKMNTLDKIIFIADYIEPGRMEAPNLDEVRPLAFTDLDLCMYRILTDTLEYLKGTDRETDPATKRTWKAFDLLINGETNGNKR
jgi:predicted HD superfamily hydrolase involved in NAD metabolism